jgi:hypothetical protein
MRALAAVVETASRQPAAHVESEGIDLNQQQSLLVVVSDLFCVCRWVDASSLLGDGPVGCSSRALCRGNACAAAGKLVGGGCCDTGSVACIKL